MGRKREKRTVTRNGKTFTQHFWVSDGEQKSSITKKIRERNEDILSEYVSHDDVNTLIIQHKTQEKGYSDTEKHVLNQFPEGSVFQWNNKNWEVIDSDKPRVQRGGGEGKTDVYIMLESEDGEEKEIKISIKKNNADFLENKLSAKRMQQLYGDTWSTDIQEDVDALAEKIRKSQDINPVQEDKITLGYRLDFTNKNSRYLSSDRQIPNAVKKEILSGAGLDENKRDSVVNGDVIVNSGIANYMLLGNAEDFNSPQDVMDNIISIDDYVDEGNVPMYLIAAAVNYRQGGKYESARPLAIRFNHTVDSNGKIQSEIVTNNPLETTSTQAAKALSENIKEKYK